MLAPRRVMTSEKISGRVLHTSIVSRVLSWIKSEICAQQPFVGRDAVLTASEMAMARHNSQSTLGNLHPSQRASTRKKNSQAKFHKFVHTHCVGARDELQTVPFICKVIDLQPTTLRRIRLGVSLAPVWSVQGCRDSSQP